MLGLPHPAQAGLGGSWLSGRELRAELGPPEAKRHDACTTEVYSPPCFASREPCQSAVGRRTTSQGQPRRLLAAQDRVMNIHARRSGDDLQYASAASVLRVCLYARRMFSVSLSGLSPYDRGHRPGCDFYTALPHCGSLLR